MSADLSESTMDLPDPEVTIRVLIVDDHAVVRSGLRAFLMSFDDLELVGIWGSAADAVWVVGGRVVCECGATTALFGKWHIGLTFQTSQGRPVYEEELEPVVRKDKQQAGIAREADQEIPVRAPE